MWVSYRWLQRHVDLSGIPPQQLVEDLTLSTAEVESLVPFAPHLADVTVGRVVTREPHPDADKLSLCTVDIGAGEDLQIVCGAANVRAGLRVAVATIGTVLPGDFKIKKSKIRGVESRGMICSVRELELGDEHDGIWELPEGLPVGRPVAEALDLVDWVFEIDNKSITHRPDLWCHRGLAREVAAIYERELKPLDTSLPPVGGGPSVPIAVRTPGCSRYLGLSLDGARNGRSPDWLRQLLLAVGQRPIDLLVDLSNFVMLDLGQPNHAFDRGQLSPEGIVVRTARAGESLTTLDGVARRLEETDLLICDGPQPVALAGIMGGEGTKIGQDTSALLLECATFHAGTVRRTSSRLGLRTDSSARFEKSLDPTLPLAAAAHYARLLMELQPDVTIPAPPGEDGDWSDPAQTLELRGERVRVLLGAELSDDQIAGLLRRLSFEVTPGAAGVLEVGVPSFRATKDVTIEQDLIEEVGRLWRYGNVPEARLVAELVPAPRDERRALVRSLEDRLAGGARFRQTLSYSFVPDELLALLGAKGAPHVRVINPVADGLSRLRRSVVPSLLEQLLDNRRRTEDLRLFEIGKGYLPEQVDAGGDPREVHELALLWARPPIGGDASFDAGTRARLLGVVEDLLEVLDLEPAEWSAGALLDPPAWAHPGRSICASLGDQRAWLAPLEPGLARELGLVGELKSDVSLALVPIDGLLAAPRRQGRYRPVPRFPGVKVDVAIAVPDAVTAAEVRTALVKAGKGLVASTELFDLYQGPKLGAGRKSLAWHVLLQATDRTLDDQDGQKFLGRVERAAGELGGELRRE